jgi:hypothetical protein
MLCLVSVQVFPPCKYTNLHFSTPPYTPNTTTNTVKTRAFDSPSSVVPQPYYCYVDLSSSFS